MAAKISPSHNYYYYHHHHQHRCRLIVQQSTAFLYIQTDSYIIFCLRHFLLFQFFLYAFTHQLFLMRETLKNGKFSSYNFFYVVYTNGASSKHKILSAKYQVMSYIYFHYKARKKNKKRKKKCKEPNGR